jgi:hypothetical protein
LSHLCNVYYSIIKNIQTKNKNKHSYSATSW